MVDYPKRKVDLSSLCIVRAKVEDADEIFQVVSDAYIIEVGTEGVAFKKKNRYLSVEAAKIDIQRASESAEGQEKPDSIYLLAREGGPEGKIVSTVRGVIQTEEDGELVCEVGPLAVSPQI